MPFCSGVIQQIQVRALPEPDQYDNTHKLALKINDAYYDFGGAKAEKFTIKDGQNWIELAVGDTVEFPYKERVYKEKTYRDAKRSQVTLVSKGSGKAPEAPAARPATNGAAKPASAPAARSSGSSGGTDWARKDAGAAASASIDKAIQALALNLVSVSGSGDIYDNILAVARRMNGLTTTLLEEILQGGTETPKQPEPKAEAPAPKAPPRRQQRSPAPAPKQESWEEEGEDLPF